MTWAKLQAMWIQLVAGVIILVLVFFLGWTIGSSRKQHDWDKATAKAYEKAAEEAQVLAEQVDETRKIHDAEIAAINSTYASALQRLRNRPDRVPRTAAATCEGSTGAQLSRPDAEFLTGLAADAAATAAEVTACHAREDEYRKAMIGNRK